MPNWSDLANELQQLGSSHDILRRRYIRALSIYTKRNVIAYYSGWLQKPDLRNNNAVNDIDKNGLMTAINGLDVSKGLDLILHTPGGDTAATESIVDYLWSKFSGNIRCFVPQMAMSAGTMIACSCREIWMGRQSSLGPIDPQFGNPQFGNIPAHGIIEEFKQAHDSIVNDPRTIPLWQPIIAKYNPAFIGECEKAITWSTSLAREWLKRNMFENEANQDQIVEAILRELIDHSISLAHNRHLSATKCREIGLKIFDLESDQKLQDKVLSVHHVYMHTLAATPAFKIIENHKGLAFILQTQQTFAIAPSFERAAMQERPPQILFPAQPPIVVAPVQPAPPAPPVAVDAPKGDGEDAQSA